MRLLLLLIYLPYSCYTQQPYGLSQLDNYSRLLNSGNLGGLGALQAAYQNGQIRSWGDVEQSNKLSGLPPLPPSQNDFVNQQQGPQPLQVAAPVMGATPGPTRPRPTARPTQAPPMQTVLIGPYGNTPSAELPPVPEEKLKGYYDDDGNFVPWGQSNGNKIQGTRLHSPIVKAKVTKRRDQSIEDYMSDDFYDDPKLKLKTKTAPMLKTIITRVEPKKNPLPVFSSQHPTKIKAIRRRKNQTRRHEVKPRRSGLRKRNGERNSSIDPKPLRILQITRDQPLKGRKKLVPLAAIERPQPVPSIPTITTTLAPVTFPPFVYRPKPKAVLRDPYFDNILQEVEEYDDFLDQEAHYRESYPYARLPMNPYLQLHPGQLLPPFFQRGVTIDNTGFIKPLENHEFIGTFDGKTPVQLPNQQQLQPQQQAQGLSQIPAVTQNPLFPTQQPFGDLTNLFQQQSPQAGQANTVTENPLLNIFKIFEFQPIDFDSIWTSKKAKKRKH